MLGPAAEHLFKTVGVAGAIVVAAVAIAFVLWRRTRGRTATPRTGAPGRNA